ncbi:AfsR/SARP family transcriptional regulator [Streptomyces cavernae]|uniref:AfsR/SARP family transcriptional regulator n=1 Tax=Streptomyces cavernae TaxID=2259034 RepID=UPI000FEC1B98|nr:BTAD domain-containing putative transcriptional regulator [Streptomyces cavernae]
MLEVRILGPAEVWYEDRRLPLGGPKPTAILVALVTRLGEVLSTDRLVDLVWEEHAPATASALVASHVAGLRRALARADGAGAIQTRSPGYLAAFSADRIDARRFEDALALGRRTAAQGHIAEAAGILRDALGLWRGRDALEGLGQSFARIEAARLAELRLVAQEETYTLELALGRADDVIPGLLAHVSAHPLRERPRGQLMTALFRTGRVPDALRVFQEGRRILRTELGIDPGNELRTLHQALLTGNTEMLGRPQTVALTASAPAAAFDTGPAPGAPAGASPVSPIGAPAGHVAAPVPGAPVGHAPAPVPGPSASTGPASVPSGADARQGRSASPAKSGATAGGATSAATGAATGASPRTVGPLRDTLPGMREPGTHEPGTHEPALVPDRTAYAPVPSAPRVPSQLPPDVADFVGREEQIAWAAEVLGGINDPTRTAPPIGVISGRSGTGKTSLAVHVGHRIADLFPDGRLFLDLRASDSTPLHTADALARLLRTLGVGADALPGDTEDLVALYRTHIAGRRVLLILDNAVGEAHLRPLLPPSPSSGVLITSRRRLVALEGAAHLDLPALAEEEALALFGRVAGPGRTGAEGDKVAEIVALCGRLPLAVRIAGARLAARPHWTPARLTARLRDGRRRLDELQVGDLELRTSLELGYADLGPQERRALRRLALMDLPDFPAWIAAPLLDVGLDEAEEAVERLVDCHLIELVGVDGVGQTRYRIHDLAREHARERCLSEEGPEEREAAVGRLVACWMSLARGAAARAPGGASRLLPEPHSELALDPAVAEELLARPADWFASEEGCLIAAVVHCSAHGQTRAARDLAGVLIASSAALYNHFDAWSRSHTVALEAVRRGGDREGEAWLLSGLGQLRYEQDRFDESYAYFRDALRLFERLGRGEGADATGAAAFLRGQAVALTGMGSARREQARYGEALELLRPALDRYERLGTQVACAHVRYGIGYVHREQGRHDEAWGELTRALELYREAADRHGEALSLRSLGLCHRARGRLAEAEELFRESLRLFEEDDDAFGAMYAGQSLAKAELRQGRLTQARERLEHCLEVTRERQDLFGEALVMRTLGECRLAGQDWDAAEESLRQALALWEKLELPLWRARTLRDLGAVAEGRGDLTAAEAARAEALEVFRRLGSREAAE